MFQSTRPRGARHVALILRCFEGQFQSTRPRGARPYSTAFSYAWDGFNPRARVGRDRR